MLDVRNAIARILDRYVLADVVDITLRKMRRDNVPIPFMVEKLLHPTPPAKTRFEEEMHPDGFLAELAGLQVTDLANAATRADSPRKRRKAT